MPSDRAGQVLVSAGTSSQAQSVIRGQHSRQPDHSKTHATTAQQLAPAELASRLKLI